MISLIAERGIAAARCEARRTGVGEERAEAWLDI
jgi:hypothetical protein